MQDLTKFKHSCPRCNMNTLKINYVVGRPYGYIYCANNCGFSYGMQHPLLNLPDGKSFEGLSVLDLPLIPESEQVIVLEDCSKRFKEQVIAAKLNNYANTWHLMPLPFATRIKIRFKYYFKILSQVRIKLTQNQLPQPQSDRENK